MMLINVFAAFISLPTLSHPVGFKYINLSRIGLSSSALQNNSDHQIFRDPNFANFSRVHATLLVTLSVCPSFGPFVA